MLDTILFCIVLPRLGSLSSRSDWAGKPALSTSPPPERLRSGFDPLHCGEKENARHVKLVGVFFLAPPAGLEPATSSLTARRSTTELQGND